MDLRSSLIGSTVSQVSFGATFVQIQTYNADSSTECWLRLGTPFLVSDQSTGEERLVDAFEKVFDGAASLLCCCGGKLTMFSFEKISLSVAFENGARLRQVWESGDLEASQLDIAHVSDEGVKEIIAIVSFPVS